MPTSTRVVGIGVPSKYLLLPEPSLGMLATVTLNRARRVSPHSTKTVSRTWSSAVLNPSVKAAVAGLTPNETRSANESSSWPMRLDLLRSRATRPSRKSKNRPRGTSHRARTMYFGSWVMAYDTEEMTELNPQQAFSRVMKSAMCRLRIMEKWR